MRSRFETSQFLSGSGLVVALTLILGVAAALAGAGLVFRLGDAHIIVITEQPGTLVAGQSLDADADAEGQEIDSSADLPHQANGESSSATVRTAAAADQPPAAVIAASPEPAPAGEPSPEPAIAAAAPPEPAIAAEASPTPVVARTRPTPGPAGPPRAAADAPIVMYHHVGPLPPDPDIYRRDLTVSPDLFERTLIRFAEQNISTVTMADLMEHFRGGTELPKRAVVLTFDDGYDDNYDHAFRLLKQHGMVGTFFITTDFVERPGYVTWEQIAEMADAGMEIGAHSVNHADFAAISPNELRRQLVEPKTLLEEHLGQPIRFLAYPAGKYNPRVMAASRAAGYDAAVTVLHGTRHTPALAFELRRVRARGTDSLSEIMARMAAASWR